MKQGIFTTEAFDISIPIRSYDETHGITLCCVILNEEKYIEEFIKYHRPYFKTILMIDGGSTDRTLEIATPLVDGIIISKFNGHFSNQVNRILEKVDTDWSMVLDYDERLEKPIMETLNNLIDQEEFDCYDFPRKNFVDGTEININYQERLHRTYCRRIRPVHGEVVGYKKKHTIPAIDGNFIIHSKTSDRHRIRNTSYGMYELKFKHEMGEPGAQTKENFERKYPYLHENNFRVR